MFYIRTGDKVSQPFTIPVWAKLFVGLFACYFFWVTVEFIKIAYFEPEIARLKDSEADKYKEANEIDLLTQEVNQTVRNADIFIETLTKEKFNEPATYH